MTVESSYRRAHCFAAYAQVAGARPIGHLPSRPADRLVARRGQENVLQSTRNFLPLKGIPTCPCHLCRAHASHTGKFSCINGLKLSVRTECDGTMQSHAKQTWKISNNVYAFPYNGATIMRDSSRRAFASNARPPTVLGCSSNIKSVSSTRQTSATLPDEQAK